MNFIIYFSWVSDRDTGVAASFDDCAHNQFVEASLKHKKVICFKKMFR